MQTAFEKYMARSWEPPKEIPGNQAGNDYRDISGFRRFVEENGLDATNTPDGTQADRNGAAPLSPKSEFID